MDKKTICPFCRQQNACAVDSSEPCWCSTVNVPEKLIALARVQQKREVCICQKCITEYEYDPNEFLKTHS